VSYVVFLIVAATVDIKAITKYFLQFF